MIVFVDTSAIFALLDQNDGNHSLATQRLGFLTAPDNTMVISNYIIVETCALLQRRIGLDAMKTFREEILPLMTTQWVTQSQHERAFSVLLAEHRGN